MAHQFAVWKQEFVSNIFLGAGQAGNFMAGSRSDKSPHHAFSNVDHSSNCYCLLTMRLPVPAAPNRKRSGSPSVFNYIEIFYNQTRRHQTLDWVSPSEFETDFHNRMTTAAEMTETSTSAAPHDCHLTRMSHWLVWQSSFLAGES
ncbi:MAG: hypothetical protein O2945_23435, partial [Planctomycetota bacterium]|nr:hypothetical protein [Planctomycetota bacterium]